MELLLDFLQHTGFGMVDCGHLIMIVVGLLFLYLGVAKHYEPLLLVPIGFGILVGNAEDPCNHLLMDAMAPNVVGVIGSAIAAGVLWSFIG